MTDNIQKLYELAEVEKEPQIIPSTGEIIGYGEYPPFTTEKQLELIKWLSDTHVFRTYTRLKKETTCFLTEREYGCDEYFCKSATLEQALAGLVIYLWQDLADEQKQAIKRILEWQIILRRT